MTGDSGDDGRLRQTLTGFAAAITSAENSREGVAVTIDRRGGFQNDLTTPKGLHALMDEPVHFGGRGEAPDPAEYLLAAVGANLSVTLTAHAALRGLRIDTVRVELSAEIDGRGFFRPGDGHPAGLLNTAIVLTVSTPEPRPAIRALLGDVRKATPVLCALKRRPRIRLIFT